MRRHLTGRFGVAATLALVAVPFGASAQGTPPAQAGPPGQVTPELAVVRETFRYPAFARRNPFVPVRSVAAGDVDPGSLRLIGVIIAADPAQSIAVLGTSLTTVAEDGSGMVRGEGGEAYYLKVGQSVGNMTVVEIHEDRIVADVVQFGLTDRMTLTLQTGISGGV